MCINILHKKLSIKNYLRVTLVAQTAAIPTTRKIINTLFIVQMYFQRWLLINEWINLSTVLQYITNVKFPSQMNLDNFFI